MKISVVIPTLNGQKSISALVSSLKSQQLLPVEIIIIDSSSEDHTVDVARNLGCKVTIIERERFDHGGTRNLGVQLSSGDIVGFLTQDAVPVNNDFLKELVKPLEDPEIAASYGRQVAHPEAFPPEKFTRLFNYPERAAIKSREDLNKLGIKTFFFSDVCSAVKKKEFLKVGLFPGRAVISEDMILAAKLILEGYKIAYVPEAAVWHSHNYGTVQQFRRNFDIGASLSMNRWILEMARAESEGYKFVKEQLRYLWQKGHSRWIPAAIALNAAKYAGYRLGLMEKMVPTVIKRSLSMNKNFWYSI